MTSLRGRVLRWFVGKVVGPRLKTAGTSVEELRRLAEGVARVQRLPPGVDVRPVQADGASGEWVCGPDARSDSAILYVHGGAFVCGSPEMSREVAARISLAAGVPVFSASYRLAPEHPFPAALQDVIAACRWLSEEGRRIVIGGESSGGGLALQALLTLRDAGAPLPAAAFFLSPATEWVRFDGESYTDRAALDPLISPEMCRYTAGLYVADSDPATPLLTPTAMDLSGLPPLLIHVGDHEVMRSDSVRLAERARECSVPVDLTVWPGMWHVFQGAARFVPEARASIREVGSFVARHLD
jgi:acetyl esterase/lipase